MTFFKCLICSILALGVASAQDVTSLAERARRGDIRAVEELGKLESASQILAALPEIKGDSQFNRALRLARAGRDGSAFLDFATEILFATGGIQQRAVNDLKQVGGNRSLRLAQVLLADFSGAERIGDLYYMANAQSVLESLPDLVSSPPAVSMTSPGAGSWQSIHQKWVSWFQEDPSRGRISTAERNSLLEAGRRKPTLAVQGALLVLLGSDIFNQLAPANGRPLPEILGIAFGGRPYRPQALTAVMQLPPADQWIVVKTIFLSQQLRAAWLGCRLPQRGSNTRLKNLVTLLSSHLAVRGTAIQVTDPSLPQAKGLCELLEMSTTNIPVAQ